MNRTKATERILRHGRVLLAGEGLVPCDLAFDGDRIVEIGNTVRYAGAEEIDASGCIILPGIVDIHGDAFERNIMPRPKTMFPIEMAMMESDRQLATNGVTTAYHAVTISWEPGLRCLAQSLKVIAAFEAIESQALVDNRLHIRWENYAIDEAADVIQLFSRPKKPLLAFNDHTTPGLAGIRNPSKFRTSAEKAMVSLEDYLTLLQSMVSRSSDVQNTTAKVAKHARDNGIAMLSHDDTSADMRRAYRDFGAHVAEFPMNWETVEAAAEAGDAIVLGAPNVVRGGSHNGAISAKEAIVRRRCHILASDYYYPALMQAALALVECGTCTLADAWALISTNPAKAAGLTDRGVIAESMRADLVVLPEGRTRPSRVICDGRIIYAEA